ncbi:hypothetical protein IPG41_00725 [Candidatus Peregrinibacteria bacterium]|nr:MAG: hypothetical protein IPG41_00725 [Candidatus Peregrinibacteria bacterium]
MAEVEMEATEKENLEAVLNQNEKLKLISALDAIRRIRLLNQPDRSIRAMSLSRDILAYIEKQDQSIKEKQTRLDAFQVRLTEYNQKLEQLSPAQQKELGTLEAEALDCAMSETRLGDALLQEFRGSSPHPIFGSASFPYQLLHFSKVEFQGYFVSHPNQDLTTEHLETIARCEALRKETMDTQASIQEKLVEWVGPRPNSPDGSLAGTIELQKRNVEFALANNRIPDYKDQKDWKISW